MSVTEVVNAPAAAPNWDLEGLFAGGSSSPAFAAFCAAIVSDLEAAEREPVPALASAEDGPATVAFILRLQDLAARISTARSFAGCLISQNVHDAAGHRLSAQTDVYQSRWQSLRTNLESCALAASEAQWQELLGDERLAPIRYYLSELRTRAAEKMPPAQEKLAQDLAVNGYHAWRRLYDRMAGDLAVELDIDGERRGLSLGQLATYMSNPRREIRSQAFRKLEEAWESRAELAALALNAQAGFRLSWYRNRRWSGFLHEPLVMGRLKEETLEAMWAAVSEAAPKLAPYIAAKKSLLGIERFCWFDQTAPVGRAGSSYAFDEAGRFVVEQLAGFSPEMAEFSAAALAQRWVEAENRPAKAAGAFCTDFPTHRASRVFMTWGGEYDHLSTLAHELGHAYHGWVLRDRPFLAGHYPMNLAETASTFNELLVTDAAHRRASDPEERLMLLEIKLQNAYIMFCNLRARFLFDSAFYAERGAGVVGRARLDELMVAAQREAFAGTLADPEGFHPLFWASKLHFFITSHPFYNFPYVFGFLFANGVYDRALAEGARFASRYRELLMDTGSMTTEEIARKHLGVDLTQRSFWDDAARRILADVEPFVAQARAAGRPPRPPRR